MSRQIELSEQIETMANHGPLCKRKNSDKESILKSTICGRDSEYIIGTFLKSFSIFCFTLFGLMDVKV